MARTPFCITVVLLLSWQLMSVHELLQHILHGLALEEHVVVVQSAIAYTEKFWSQHGTPMSQPARCNS